MNKLISTLAAACSVALTMSAPAYAAGYDPNYIGSPGSANSVNRTITVTPETKWVNVDDRETVRFVNAKNGQSFVWNFDIGGAKIFELSKIAPPAMQFDPQVKGFVAEQMPPDRDR